MQLFGILLVLNRKSRLGRQHSRTSGASRVRGANGHWKTASYCLMCSMTDDRWRWRGSDDRRIRKEGKSMWRFFQWIYQAFFHKSPTTILPLSNLSIFRRAYMVTMQQPHARTTCDKNHCGVYCYAKCIWLQTDKQIQFDTHAVYTVHTKSFTELHSAQQDFWNSEIHYDPLMMQQEEARRKHTLVRAS